MQSFMWDRGCVEEPVAGLNSQIREAFTWQSFLEGIPRVPVSVGNPGICVSDGFAGSSAVLVIVHLVLKRPAGGSLLGACVFIKRVGNSPFTVFISYVKKTFMSLESG